MKLLSNHRSRALLWAAVVLMLSACASTDENTEPPDSDGDGVYDFQDSCNNTPAGALITAEGCPVDTDGDGVPDYLDTCPDTEPGAAACAFGCELGEAIVINLVNDEFEFDSAELKPEMKVELDELIAKLRAHPDLADLTVVGHTDNVGTDEYNMGLSLRRAYAVVNYLKAHGLESLTYRITGKGELEPIDSNETEEGRSRNRRVEIFTHSAEEHCCSSGEKGAVLQKGAGSDSPNLYGLGLDSRRWRA